jgi:hypothetical protein
MNVNQRVEGNKLVIEIDLDQSFGASSTGKSLMIASTNGFNRVESPKYAGVSFSLNVTKRNPDYRGK